MTTTQERSKSHEPPAALLRLKESLSGYAVWDEITTWLTLHDTHCRQSFYATMSDEQRLASWIQARVLETALSHEPTDSLTQVVQSLLSPQVSRGLIIMAPNVARWKASVEALLPDHVLAHPLYHDTWLDHASPPHAFADERYRLSPTTHDTYVLPYTLWVDADQWPRLQRLLENQPIVNTPLIVLCEPHTWLKSIPSMTVLTHTLAQFESTTLWLGPNPLQAPATEATDIQWHKQHCLTTSHKWWHLKRLVQQVGVDAILVDSAYECGALTERLSIVATHEPIMTRPLLACWSDVNQLVHELRQTHPLTSEKREWHMVSWSTPSAVLPWVIQCADTLTTTRITLLSCRDDHGYRVQKLGQARRGHSPFNQRVLDRYAQWLRYPCSCAPKASFLATPPTTLNTGIWQWFSRINPHPINCDQCHSISSGWRNLRHLLLY